MLDKIRSKLKFFDLIYIESNKIINLFLGEKTNLKSTRKLKPLGHSLTVFVLNSEI